MSLKKRYFLLPILIFSFGYMIFSTYSEVRNKTILEFNKQQMLLAKQAAKGIESFFNNYYRNLTYLSGIDDIISFNDQGKKLMHAFIANNSQEIRAITRVDAAGRIIYTVPYNQRAIGADISSQDHIQKIIKYHKPVISDVFTAVQGYKAIAYHVPIMKNNNFMGTLAVLIPFERLSKEYLENIKIREGGYAWVISQKGVELYCPVPGHVGETIFNTSGKFPSVISMAKEMMKGNIGTTTYTYDRLRGEKIDTITKHAAYFPIQLGNTFWSIVVASPENEVLSTMAGFRNKLSLIIALFFVASLSYLYFTVKAWTVLKEESKRKRAEEALRESEEKYRLLVENAPAGIYEIDMEKLKFISVNDVMCEYTGYSKEEFLALDPYDLLTENSKDVLNKLLEGVFSGNQNPSPVEYKIKGKNDRLFWVLVNSRFFYKDGVPKRATAVVHDLTTIRQAEKDKRKLEDQLLQIQKMESIGNLAGGVAHEFNNILSIIIGNNELVMDQLPEGSPAGENAEEIRIAGMRARDVVKQLLTFSRQDSALKKVINFRSTVQESMKLIRSSTPANIEIQQTLSEDVCPVFANGTQINQLLINLCNNAIDAMPTSGGMLTIELLNETVDEKHAKLYSKLKPGQYVKLVVSDNGIGMDNETIDRMFEPYYTTKEIGKGTGIGLAVVHGIIERHGGSVTANSQPGRGTTFTIFFPAHKGLTEKETDKEIFLPTGKECILYVDDEPSIARLGKRHLETLGYTAESTTDPLEALEMVKTDLDKFDLVISDMAMPNMTGEKLALELMKIRPDIPIILCTGYSNKMSEDLSSKIGIKAFTYKPIEKADLAKTVRKVLDDDKE